VTRTSWHVVEHHQVELYEARGVGEQVDFDDLPTRDREAKDDERLSAPHPHQSRSSIHGRSVTFPLRHIPSSSSVIYIDEQNLRTVTWRPAPPVKRAWATSLRSKRRTNS